jgi:hypothetical protein
MGTDGQKKDILDSHTRPRKIFTTYAQFTMQRMKRPLLIVAHTTPKKQLDLPRCTNSGDPYIRPELTQLAGLA